MGAAQSGNQWGNSVVIQPNPVSAIAERFTVFDNGIRPPLSNPMVLTLSLDIEDLDGSPLISDDQVWARVSAGVGGYRREFELDWRNGVQATFVAMSLRVDAMRLTGAGPRPLRARANVGVGARNTSARSPTWTTPQLTGLVAHTLAVPKHARALSVITNDGSWGAGDTLAVVALVTGRLTTLSLADVRLSNRGELWIPVDTTQVVVQSNGVIPYRIQFALDL